MWKPTKVGAYLCGGKHADLADWTLILYIDGTVEGSSEGWEKRRDEYIGPWSIIAPDWQPGAPTVAQLSRWQWWAIWGGSGQMMVAGMVAELRLDYVLRSAPIQPDLNNGPLWVPLGVAK